MVSKGVRSFARLLLCIVIARQLGASAFGVFFLLSALEAVAVGIANALGAAPLLSLLPKASPAVRACLLRQSALVTGAVGLVGAIAACCGFLLVASPAIAAQTSQLALVAFGVTLALRSAGLAGRAALVAEFRGRRLLGVECLEAGVTLAGVLGGSYLVGASQAVVWSSLAVANGFALLLLLRSWSWLGPDAGRVERLERPVRSRLLKFGGVLAAGSVAYALGVRLHPVVLGRWAGPEAVGLFGASLTAAGAIRLLSMAVSDTVRPRLALALTRGESARAERCLWIGLAQVGLPGLALTLVGWFLPNLVPVKGTSFAGVESLLPMAFAYAALESMGAVVVAALQSIDRNGAAAATKLRALASLLSLALLVPVCEANGAAGALALLALTELAFLVAACGSLFRRWQPSERPLRYGAVAASPARSSTPAPTL
jgi:O-antigen/teichoic acid export membrane protein